jgi:hypothetical protein
MKTKKIIALALMCGCLSGVMSENVYAAGRVIEPLLQSGLRASHQSSRLLSSVQPWNVMRPARRVPSVSFSSSAPATRAIWNGDLSAVSSPAWISSFSRAELKTRWSHVRASHTWRDVPLARSFSASPVSSSVVLETPGFTPSPTELTRTLSSLNKQSFHQLPIKKVIFLDKNRERFITPTIQSDSSLDHVSLTELGDTIVSNLGVKKK